MMSDDGDTYGAGSDYWTANDEDATADEYATADCWTDDDWLYDLGFVLRASVDGTPWYIPDTWWETPT